ncbi:MAG: UDP-3-O-(3-hydroxymyristoyl)glucosamine N-acyltransferase [Fimbriimonadaceae bacterium]|nr:UDP-3-O-(3-hydroxymyristoyl)glucosamine N-acyltransferase [Fimbriimonadaceae bacterium]
MKLSAVAVLLEGTASAAPELEVRGLNTPATAAAGELVVAFDDAAVALAEAGPCAAVVVPRGAACGKPHIAVADPRRALARLLVAFAPPPPAPRGVHPRALVDPSATLGEGLSIGPGAVIGAGTAVADGCRIGANTVVGEHCSLGPDCVLHPNVTLYDHSHLGSRVVVHAGTVIGADGFGYQHDGQAHQKVPQLGGVQIDDDVEIGANSTIDRATLGFTRIGAGSKIDNLVMVGHNVQLGRQVLLVAQCGIAGSSVLEDGVVLAGQAGVADHLRIGAGTVLLAQCGVMRDVPAGSRLGGSPGLPQHEWFRQLAAIRRLEQTGRRVSRLEAAVDELRAGGQGAGCGESS